MPVPSMRAKASLPLSTDDGKAVLAAKTIALIATITFQNFSQHTNYYGVIEQNLGRPS